MALREQNRAYEAGGGNLIFKKFFVIIFILNETKIKIKKFLTN